MTASQTDWRKSKSSACLGGRGFSKVGAVLEVVRPHDPAADLTLAGRHAEAHGKAAELRLGMRLQALGLSVKNFEQKGACNWLSLKRRTFWEGRTVKNWLSDDLLGKRKFRRKQTHTD
jgi:hypothetical protein